MEDDKTEKPPRHDGRATYYKFKQNNIWGKVHEEELLNEVTSQLDGIGVQEKNSVYVDRGPESYEVDRDVLKEYKKEASLDRKRRRIDEMEVDELQLSEEDDDELESDSSVSSGGLCAADTSRIRSWKPSKSKKSKNVKRAKISDSQTETEEDHQFVMRIALGLREDNYGLIGQITELLGQQKVEKIYRKILKIEKLGGIMTKNLKRRRTPGGAFFYLIRNHPSTASPELKRVFAADSNKESNPKPSKGIGPRNLESNEDGLDPSTMPYFDYSVNRNISTVVGQHAFLLCRVHRTNDIGVSWIRKRDLHILTAGVLTYTSDQRFVVIHQDKTENWTLQIKYPQKRDSGVYECQVNTEPKISMAFHLTVIESKARILGGSDVHVKSGSSLRLTCEVDHGPHDIAQVFWYHGANLIDQHGLNGEEISTDIHVTTQSGDLLRSQLTIPKVKSNHSGNYTCSPTIAAPASLIVHVISGEHPAAMQHSNRSSSNKSHFSSMEYLFLFALLSLLSSVIFNSSSSSRTFLVSASS